MDVKFTGVAYDSHFGQGPSWPKTKCCTEDAEGCVCSSMERALRGWERGDDIPPMNEAHRSECLSEIGKVEGYSAADYQVEDDKTLAGAVLSAWLDYCRDKGLI